MQTLPPQSFLGWKVSVTVLHLLAISSAVYRLRHRFRIRRAWWDDYVVFVPLALDAIYTPLFWIRFLHREDTTSRLYEIMRSYWLSTVPFLLVIWSSRIALSLSLARLFPQKHAARLWSFFLVITMGLSCLSCFLVSALSCHHSSALLVVNDKKDCESGADGFPIRTLYLFAEDFVADALLVLSPIFLFWKLKLPRRERILVLMVFSGSVLTLMSAVVFTILNNDHMVSLGPDARIIIAGLQYIEAGISLFASNLAVVSTCFYQRILRYYKLERPRLGSTEETARLRSRPCTCFEGTPTPLTLTEVSISNIFESDRSEHPETQEAVHSLQIDTTLPVSSTQPPLVLLKPSKTRWFSHRNRIWDGRAIAVSTTILRIIHRFRMRKAWWDDYILFIPLVFNLAYWVVFCWGYSQPTGLRSSKDDDSTQDSIFDSYWLATFPGILVWWGTRTVQALTLTRTLPISHPMRRWSYILIAIDTVLGLVGIAVTIGTCNVASALLNHGEFQECVKGPGGFSVHNIFLFAGTGFFPFEDRGLTDIAAPVSLTTDVLLVTFSTLLLCRVAFSNPDRRVVVAVLTASVIMILYTISYLVIIDTKAVLMGRSFALIETGLHNIKTGFALLLCNLPVIVTCLFPHLYRSRSIESSSGPSSASESGMYSYSSHSCCSGPPTPLTLTDISEFSCTTSHRSVVSEELFGSIYSSWHASQATSSCSAVEMDEKLPTTDEPENTSTVLPPQSYVAWKGIVLLNSFCTSTYMMSSLPVSTAILHALSTASTIYRLVHRFRIHRTWWDDRLVFVALLSNVLYGILFLIRFKHRGSFDPPSHCSLTYLGITVIYPVLAPEGYQILSSYWLSLFPYLLSVWTMLRSARGVLSLSLGRIFPDKHPARTLSYFLSTLMIISFVGCTVTPAVSCRYPSPLLILYEATYCATVDGKYLVSMIVLVTASEDSIVCDVLLFISPLIVFWRIKLPLLERRLVLIFFCGSVLTLSMAFVFAILFLNRRIFTGEDWLIILIGMFNIESAAHAFPSLSLKIPIPKAAVALFASNLIVVSTCLYQAVRRVRRQGRDPRPVDESRGRAPQIESAPSRLCSCVRQSDRSPPPERLTLTEISTYLSSLPPMDDEIRAARISDDASHSSKTNLVDMLVLPPQSYLGWKGGFLPFQAP
ncbi:LOW QUALITY PROTEIN: hypothetical protein CVT26_001820 [Gymnopilus dilepis]|uniref:Rhodopsin domain-containing protein n=1 Tax=Gymnopilus dilepis TaxID=231916 RepID=A0A409VRS8_9AGAR|nr:LOW QUALITY PROTEIN: hypothetical protein CVT26_001820 [Gymnopilus dilepis]